MTAIALTLITLSVIIFFFISQSVFKFFPNKRQKHWTVIAYAFQFIGLTGLIIYHTEFLSTPPLQIKFDANSPDFIRAIAELLWPITAILAIFWFLPQILEFLKDPRKAIPLLTAFAGRHVPQEHQAFTGSVDVKNLPHYANLSDAHKELIESLKTELQNFSAEEEKSRLLIYAADCQLLGDFERFYTLIYGSQIQALQMLSANTSADLSSFYEMHKQKTEEVIKARHSSFEDWVRLLLETGLVSETGSKFSLANKGKEFLKFLKKREYDLLKSF